MDFNELDNNVPYTPKELLDEKANDNAKEEIISYFSKEILKITDPKELAVKWEKYKEQL